jgi:hypothetical protein
MAADLRPSSRFVTLYDEVFGTLPPVVEQLTIEGRPPQIVLTSE